MTDHTDLAAMDAAIQSALDRLETNPYRPTIVIERAIYRAGHAAGVIEGVRERDALRQLLSDCRYKPWDDALFDRVDAALNNPFIGKRK